MPSFNRNAESILVPKTELTVVRRKTTSMLPKRELLSCVLKDKLCSQRGVNGVLKDIFCSQIISVLKDEKSTH